MLPYELSDMVLYQLDTIGITIDLHRLYIAKKIVKRHSHRYTIYNVCMDGNLKLVKLLHNIGSKFTTKAMDLAAGNGCLEVVKWLHQNRTEGCTEWAMSCAAQTGYLELVKWLHNNRNEGCNIWAMNSAARTGCLEVIQWLHQNRTEGCTTYAICWAAGDNYLEVVKWLYKNRPECHNIELAIQYAIGIGYRREVINNLRSLV
jgi:hypothetical protein